MRFTIPFRYDAQYVLKGRRTPSFVAQIGEATVDIREPESPVLAFVAGHDIENKDDCIVFGRTAAGAARVWDVDGAYYAERVKVEDFVEAATSSRAENQNPFAAYANGRTAMPFYRGREESYKECRTLADIQKAHGDVRSWDDPGGVTEARDIALRASEAVVIDGMVCFAVTEPVLVVTVSDGSVCIAVVEMTPGGASDFSLQTEVGAHLLALRFRLDDKESALRYAAALARLEQLPVRDGAEVSSVRTHLRFSSEAENLYTLCHSFESRLQGSVGSMEAEMALAWCDLRDACMRTNQSLSPEMVSALETLVHTVERSGADGVLAGSVGDRHDWQQMTFENNGSYDERSKPEPWLAAVAFLGRLALDDWYARPQSGNEWVDHALPGQAVNGAASGTRQILDRRQLDILGRKLSMDLEPYRDAAARGETVIVEVESEGHPHVAIVGRDGPDLQVRQLLGAYGRNGGESAVAVVEHALRLASDKLEEEYAMGDLAL